MDSKTGTVEHTARKFVIQIQIVCTDTQHGITPAVFKTHGSIQFAGVTCKQHHLDTGFGSDIHQT